MIQFIPDKEVDYQVLKESDFSIYRERWHAAYGTGGYVISDSYSELKRYYDCHKILNSKKAIKPKNKVYFSKHTSFPPSLLSKLKTAQSTDLSRTIKESAADVIVLDTPFQKETSYYDWCQNYMNSIFIIHFENGLVEAIKETDYKDKTSEEIVGIHDWALTHFKQGVYYALHYDHIDALRLGHEYSDRLISSSDLLLYVQSHLPKPDDAQWESLMSMIQSADEEQKKLGWDLLQLHDLSDRYFELYQVLSLMQGNWTLPNASSRSSAMTFVTDQVGVPYQNIGRNTLSSQNTVLMMRNPLASSVTKGKLFKHLKSAIADEIQDWFNAKLKLAGLRAKITTDSDAELIDNPNYTEAQVVAEIVQSLNHKSGYWERTRKAMEDYGLKMIFERQHDA